MAMAWCNECAVEREREYVCSAETGKQSMKLDAVNVYSLGDLSVNT